MKLIKLVRDGISLLPGGKIVYKPIPEEDKISELRKKLVEEALEYFCDPCEAELADVLSVVVTLANSELNCSLNQLRDVSVSKDMKRGSFEYGIGMFITTAEDEV